MGTIEIKTDLTKLTYEFLPYSSWCATDSLSHMHAHARMHTQRTHTPPPEGHTAGGLSQLAQSQGVEGDMLSEQVMATRSALSQYAG